MREVHNGQKGSHAEAKIPVSDLDPSVDEQQPA
jgi:hypothetical protein